MFCKHNYEYTQGHFFCTKCGNRKHSGSYRHHRRGKRIGIGLGISLAIIIVFYVIVINPDTSIIPSSVMEEFQKLKSSIPELLKPKPDPQLNKPEIIISELEQKIYIRINQERGSRPLVYDNMIATVARVHSQDMATNNFFRHDSSSGVSVIQRGKNAGFSCGPLFGYMELIGLDNRFGHTEDIYSVSTYHWLNEDELANLIVRAWMDDRSSSAGRNAILGFLDNSVGVGVAITSDDKVYVTADFC